jgi:hypothetical protein
MRSAVDAAVEQRYQQMIRSAGIPDFPEGLRPSRNGHH